MPPSQLTSPRKPGHPQQQHLHGPPTPAKPIDLNSSTATMDRSTLARVTRRAFLLDLVVDESSVSDETKALLVDLGNPLSYPLPMTNDAPSTPSRPSTPDPAAGSSAAWTADKRAQAREQLRHLQDELLKTERSYFQRVKALKSSYADPLRRFAKSAATQIIPLYEAKTLFANIDAIVPAAGAFLADLERMGVQGLTVGDVCLQHFKTLKTFDCYRAYYSQQDESHKTFHDCVRKHSSFNSFIESTKYQTTGMNNIGLRELLMEPVQRLPRYTLFWQSMLKCMHPTDPERYKIEESMAIASRIAKCEADAQTTKATVMYCLGRTIEGLPADIISNSRDYVDSLDVDDVPVEQFEAARPTSPQGKSPARPGSIMSASTSTSSHQSLAIASPGGNASILHCTLFLFDDKLVITKRPSRDVSGRKATGLDDLQKLVKTGGGVAVYDRDKEKRDKLGFRGAVDILDVIATDTGGGEFHLFLERPPLDQSDRWNARPLRSYTTVHPPYSINLDPVMARKDKLRFVRNLWAAQALARTRLRKRTSGPAPAIPRVFKAREEIKLATCYWNVWERDGWTGAMAKAKVVVLVDESGDAQGLPLGGGVAPLAVVRLQPMQGGICRYSLMTGSGEDVGERAVIDTSEVIEHIVTAIHRLGIFSFRTSTSSCPTTPSNTHHRLRPTMLNLDAISRNLFGTGTSSSSDIFGTTSSKRTKSSAMSRTSTSDGSTTEGLMASAKKLSHRPKSISSLHDLEARSSPYQSAAIEKSERDLNERLDLARRNSRSVASREGIFKLEAPAMIDNAVIEEEREIQAEAEEQLRRALTVMEHSTLPQHDSPLRIVNRTPSPTRPPVVPTTRVKSPTAPLVFSPKSTQRAVIPSAPLPATTEPLDATAKPLSPPTSPKPLGPRSLPSLSRAVLAPPPLGSTHTKLRIVSGTRRVSGNHSAKSDHSSRVPSPPPMLSATKRQHSSDPFAPRKRSPSGSPMQKEALSPNVAPPQARNSVSRPARTPSKNSNMTPTKTPAAGDVEMAEQRPEAALASVRNRITASRKAVKLLRNELDTMHARLGREPSFKDRLQRIDGNGSMPRSPQTRNIRRHADLDDMGRVVDLGSVSSKNSTYSKMEIDLGQESIATGVNSVVQQLDRQLRKALADSELAMEWGTTTAGEIQKLRLEIDRLHGQLARSKRHQELVETHLAEAQGEVDIIYEAFNEELDGMFNDANLPETEAFAAMRRDLQVTKASRNELALENMKLKRDLAEANLKREEWASILRSRGVL